MDLGAADHHHSATFYPSVSDESMSGVFINTETKLGRLAAAGQKHVGYQRLSKAVGRAGNGTAGDADGPADPFRREMRGFNLELERGAGHRVQQASGDGKRQCAKSGAHRAQQNCGLEDEPDVTYGQRRPST